MDVKFDGRSRRAAKARLAHGLKTWVPSLNVGVILLLLGGFVLVGFGVAIGWALIGLAAIPAMTVEWYKSELSDLPIEKGGKRLDQIIDSEILGLLPIHPTPQQIAEAIGLTSGGHFFAVRFGISGQFLGQVVSTNPDDSDAVFDEALKIADQTDGRVSAGVLTLALFRQISQRRTLLGHLQLDEDDIIRGIAWNHRLSDLVRHYQSRPKHPGGIGRDWSFGWIPTLSRFGVNISNTVQSFGNGVRDEIISQLEQQLTGGRKSVALVGPAGVGKTEVVYEFASRLMDDSSDKPSELSYHQVFMLDASRLLSVASGPGELERLVNLLLSEAFSAKNIIVFLDNAEVFFQEGVGTVDITNLLLPIIEAGRLPMILAFDEQSYLKISKRTPSLTNAANRVNLRATSESDTLNILQDKLIEIEFTHKVTYMYQALREAYKLGQRYIYDVAMPGQAITLLEAAAEYAESGLVTAGSVNEAIEKSIGVKTKPADEDAERQMLLNLESLIHQRMIGQDRAVGVVADALRRARAGVRNQKRPVGTFLFLGPTGVGKTELAKSLAAIYFGGEEKMIRLDMNEFVSSSDVGRLIADGAEDSGSLTARVMKQPFSVILLDEIEKAHSSVLSTLLQLLDEGVLRDVRGREVNFRDTIVIATSNAGADRIQEYLRRGYDLEQFEEKFVDELISGDIFHPEFLNRFDEIVVFGPLEKSQLLKVVDLILDDVNKNLAAQKISVTVAPEAKEYLVEAGYDPRLGARPMRRVVQRTVESTIAKLMLARDVEAGGSIEITLDQVRSAIGKKTAADKIINEGNHEQD